MFHGARFDLEPVLPEIGFQVPRSSLQSSVTTAHGLYAILSLPGNISANCRVNPRRLPTARATDFGRVVQKSKGLLNGV
jgi:hypothetical protein